MMPLTNSLLGLGLNASHLGGALGVLRRLVVLHERESKDLLDAVVVRQEHDQTVDAHTPATSRGQAVFQAGAEVLVDDLGLVVTLVLLAGLLLESQTLVEGVVQLGVGVDNLLLADEGLETLAETGVLAVVLGQRRHHLGVAGDEGGVDAGLLDELTHQLVQHTGVGHGRRALDTGLLEHALQELAGLGGVQLVAGRELLAGGLLEGRDHLHAPPGGLPVDVVLLAGLGVERRLVAAGNVLHETRDQLFRQVHDVENIGVGPVELASREFGVVGQVDTLVTELTAHLVHTLQTTDDEHLQVQLGGDTHEQVHVVLVVVGDEGLGGGTTGDSVHHGGLDLDEIAGVEVVADVADDLGAGDEDVAGSVVHDQIQVALAETLLLVLETVVLRGDGVQAGSQEHNLLGEDGKLSIGTVLGGTATGESDDTDNVTSPQVFVLVLEGDVSAGVLGLAHNLHLNALGTDVVEDQLGAGGTLGVDTTGNADGGLGLLFTLLQTLVLLEELAQVILDVELVGVGVGLLVLAQLVDALAADFEVLLDSEP